jgi:hypothetical protein
MATLDVKDWIALVSSVGTFLSSIFVLITLFELRTQRKQSYIPDLIIPDVVFNYSNEFSNYIKIWKMDNDEELSLKILNIGLGVAKDIHVEWEYDIYDTIKNFYLLSSTTKGDIHVDTASNRLVYVENGELLSNTSLSVDNQHINFLLPNNKNNEMHDLHLPNSYITIATAIYKNAKIGEVFDLKAFDGMISPLTLSIRYKDVGGNNIIKKFKVEVKFFVKSINLKIPFTCDNIIEMRGRVYIKDL